ncbi:putative glycoside hydrolase [Lentzea sp. CC55]|uniref:putative glycoside hydrolase n=1 Tax=Lentzea sp. CC55 TaxID=2884909 RepID=UPI001F210574|nr:putative glycoside hydrolase [Lentzea sp. CC55]MCG8926062.1 putative glycoside hydrolase [Lentzea sp. CC55]
MSAPVRRSELILLVFLGVVFAVSSTVVVASVAHIRNIGLTVEGIEDGAVLRASAFRGISIGTDDEDSLDRVEVFVDDAAVTPRRDGERLLLDGFVPTEGRHLLTARVRSATALVVDAVVDHEFTIDNTAPSLAVQHIRSGGPRAPVVIRGTADGAELVRIGHTRAHVDNGVFTAVVASAPATIFVEARDAAGNSAGRHVVVPVPRPAVRAEHVTVEDWASPPARERVLAMARRGEIDAVRLDVKDETGQVAHSSRVALAQQIGAVNSRYDPRAAVDELHRAGVRAVARIVAFHDPVLARASARSGMRDHLGDTALTLTNSAHPEVRGYVVALAREAASLGFDDVLLDHFGSESDVDFLAEVRDAVRAAGACFGVVAADGADVPADFIVPAGR